MKPFVVEFTFPSGREFKAVYMAKTSNEARNYFLVENKGTHFLKVTAYPVGEEEKDAKPAQRN